MGKERQGMRWVRLMEGVQSKEREGRCRGDGEAKVEMAGKKGRER